MLRPPLRFLMIAVAMAVLAGCGWMPWGNRRRAETEQTLAAARRAPLVVGRVTLVNVREGFALIEGSMVQPPAAGTTLRIYTGAAVSAELRATGVRRRPFLVADVVNGMPVKGDLVMQPRSGEMEPPKALPVSPAASPTPSPRARGGAGYGFSAGGSDASAPDQ